MDIIRDISNEDQIKTLGACVYSGDPSVKSEISLSTQPGRFNDLFCEYVATQLFNTKFH